MGAIEDTAFNEAAFRATCLIWLESVGDDISLLPAPIHLDFAPLYHCTNVPIHQFTLTLHTLHHCTMAPLHHGTNSPWLCTHCPYQHTLRCSCLPLPRGLAQCGPDDYLWTSSRMSHSPSQLDKFNLKIFETNICNLPSMLFGCWCWARDVWRRLACDPPFPRLKFICQHIYHQRNSKSSDLVVDGLTVVLAIRPKISCAWDANPMRIKRINSKNNHLLWPFLAMIFRSPEGPYKTGGRKKIQKKIPVKFTFKGGTLPTKKCVSCASTFSSA